VDSSLLPFVQVNVSWAAEHRWKPGDGVTALSVGQYALWLVLGGAVVVRTADREYQLPAGTACLLPERVPRDLATPDGGWWLSVGFTASLFVALTCFKAWRRRSPGGPSRLTGTPWSTGCGAWPMSGPRLPR
jgi:hypothetical protein